MARKPRIHLPGGVYHVMLRGYDGNDIFKTDNDRWVFESLIEQGVERYGHRIDAYCWMVNHVHLAVQVEDTPLSKIMQNLAFRYTRYFNKTYDRIGHLFQGCYKAILVDANTYLQELVRYIHLNPVRAGVFSKPGQYRWSGHSRYLGNNDKPWLTTHWVLSLFSRQTKAAIKRYQAFVQSGMDEGYREEFHIGPENGTILGSGRFIESAMNVMKSPGQLTLDGLIDRILIHLDVTGQDLQSPTRNRLISEYRAIIGYAWKTCGAGSIKKYADWLGRDDSTVIRNIARLESKIATDRRLKERVDKINNTVIQA